MDDIKERVKILKEHRLKLIGGEYNFSKWLNEGEELLKLYIGEDAPATKRFSDLVADVRAQVSQEPISRYKAMIIQNGKSPRALKLFETAINNLESSLDPPLETKLQLMKQHRQLFYSGEGYFDSWLGNAASLLSETFGASHPITQKFVDLTESFKNEIQTVALKHQTEKIRKNYSMLALKQFEHAIFILQGQTGKTEKQSAMSKTIYGLSITQFFVWLGSLVGLCSLLYAIGVGHGKTVYEESKQQLHDENEKLKIELGKAKDTIHLLYLLNDKNLQTTNSFDSLLKVEKSKNKKQ